MIMKNINSKKARNNIASLINTIECGRIMIASAEEKKTGEDKQKSIDLWQDAITDATQELGDLYGIELPCYLPKV